jgi:hypothetical protein
MIGCKQGSRGIILAVTKMALTREDIQALLRILDEDPQLLQELRRRILPDHFVFEVRFPTEWMAQVDRRLANLERDVADLKNDVGRLKGMSKEISFRQKAGAYLGVLLRGGRDASELVNKILDEAEAEGLITPQEADYVRAADLLWVGTVKRGKFAGQKLIIVAEISWVADEEDVERAIERAQILRKAKAWAVPFVVGEEWGSQEVKEKALQRSSSAPKMGELNPSALIGAMLSGCLRFGTREKHYSTSASSTFSVGGTGIRKIACSGQTGPHFPHQSHRS